MNLIHLRYRLFVAAFLACGVITSCSEEGVEAPVVAQPGTMTICLDAGGAGSRAGQADIPDNMSPSTYDERTINDLRYFAFPADASAPGAKVLKGRLIPPTQEELADGRYKEYVVRDVEPGSYRVYVVANMPECADAATESQLKALRLDYGKSTLPEAGNLPMIHEPQGITEVAAGGTVVTASLHFTCVKVRYNLIFDKENNENTATAFGNRGLIIKSVNGHNLSASTPLVLGGATAGEAASFSSELPSGRYYATWGRNDNAAGHEDVINGVDGVPATYADRWVYQGTLYLPERYTADSEKQSALSIEAVVVDNTLAPDADGKVDPADIPTGSVNTYRIELGHENEKGQPRQFPRGTYYEIIGQIETTEFTELQAEVKVAEWVPVAMAHMGHTTLSVDKTEAKVTSIESDSIRYVSNAAEVTLGCDDMIDGRPVIVQYGQNTQSRVIKFRINPDIPIGAFAEGSKYPPTGKAKIWIQANHLRKYLDVSYNVQPFFEVTPKDVAISWLENLDSDPTYTKTFHFQTNLGGIAGIDFPAEMSVGSARIKVECDNPSASVGTFTVTALNNPGTTTLFNLTLKPGDGSNPGLAETVIVRVKPPLGDYRVYFRPINDEQGANNWHDAPFNTVVLPEGGENNWTTTWSGPFFYCYSQMGETIGGVIPEYYVWLFSEAWPGNLMTKDQTNKGWYYFNIAPDKIATNGMDGSTKTIIPGETLMMFNSGGDGAHRHRCTHHLDPGLQLFDYEDREGWVLYDPLRAPYYSVYDMRPEIVNARYDIYTQLLPTKWDISYGLIDAEKGKQCTIFGTPVYTQEEVNGVTLYHTQFEFKAPVGDLAKNIVIYFADGSKTMLFDGDNYATSDATAEGYCYKLEGRLTWSRTPVDIEIPMRRIYLKNNENWASPYLHYWIDENNTTSWPGIAMKQLQDGSQWWYLDIQAEYNHIIVSDNGASQSPNRQIPTGTDDLYINNQGIVIGDRP